MTKKVGFFQVPLLYIPFILTKFDTHFAVGSVNAKYTKQRSDHKSHPSVILRSQSKYPLYFILCGLSGKRLL